MTEHVPIILENWVREAEGQPLHAYTRACMCKHTHTHSARKESVLSENSHWAWIQLHVFWTCPYQEWDSKNRWWCGRWIKKKWWVREWEEDVVESIREAREKDTDKIPEWGPEECLAPALQQTRPEQADRAYQDIIESWVFKRHQILTTLAVWMDCLQGVSKWRMRFQVWNKEGIK